MKNALIVVGVSILVLACTGPATAQEIELTPEMKKWEPVLGKWSGEQEVRDSPTGAWTKHSVEWDFRSKGYYVEVQWKTNPGGQDVSSVEIIGYDPLQRGYISYGFASDGLRGAVTSSGWTGTTIAVNWTQVTAEREIRIGRITWEYSSDFESVTATGEVFSDGEWWAASKFKLRKVK